MGRGLGAEPRKSRGLTQGQAAWAAAERWRREASLHSAPKEVSSGEQGLGSRGGGGGAAGFKRQRFRQKGQFWRHRGLSMPVICSSTSRVTGVPSAQGLARREWAYRRVRGRGGWGGVWPWVQPGWLSWKEEAAPGCSAWNEIRNETATSRPVEADTPGAPTHQRKPQCSPSCAPRSRVRPAVDSRLLDSRLSAGDAGSDL